MNQLQQLQLLQELGRVHNVRNVTVEVIDRKAEYLDLVRQMGHGRIIDMSQLRPRGFNKTPALQIIEGQIMSLQREQLFSGSITPVTLATCGRVNRVS